MKRRILIVFAIAVVLTLILVALLRRSNPLKKYGVHMEWSFGGATSSVPSLFVWWEDGKKRIDGPYIFGGVVDPSLTFTDVDGDGIPDMVFSDSRGRRRVVAFHPGIAGKGPTFVILENSIPGD